MVPPDPFPNSEVKRFSGDDICRATDRENSSSPELWTENKQRTSNADYPPEMVDFLW